MNKKRIIIPGCLGLMMLALSIFLSVAFGARTTTMETVLRTIFDKTFESFEANVVRARIPRTVFGVLAGAGLGVSGVLMQAITRNPIADPGILGVNTGASLAVVVGMAFFHISAGTEYVLLSFIGAIVTAVFVYSIASFGYGGVTPMKLALAGAATSTALGSLVNTIMMPNDRVMDQFRFWQVGSIGGTGWDEIKIIMPYILAGIAIAIILAPALNAMALGDEMATGLGINVKLVRGIAAFSGVLLCSTVTAFAGPIGFVGLMIPHLMKLLVGQDYRCIVPMSALGGSCLLVLADVIGRVLGRPGELEVGVVTAMIGAPVFVAIVRKAKVGRT